MRGKRAKALRRIAYGDRSQRDERVYQVEKHPAVHVQVHGVIRKVIPQTLHNHPDQPRGKFLGLKRLYKKLKRQGKMWKGLPA